MFAFFNIVLIMNLSKRRQFFRFVVIGVSSALFIDLIFYSLLLAFVSSAIAKAVGFILGSFFSYILNKRWTFQSRYFNGLELFRFYCVYLASLSANICVNEYLLNVLENKFDYAFITAYSISTITSALLNFLGLKLIVFSSSR